MESTDLTTLMRYTEQRYYLSRNDTHIRLFALCIHDNISVPHGIETTFCKETKEAYHSQFMLIQVMLMPGFLAPKIKEISRAEYMLLSQQMSPYLREIQKGDCDCKVRCYR